MTEHTALEVFRNPHGVLVYPALRTQNELVRGRRAEPAVRYSQDEKGQWKRGLENLRTLVGDSDMPLAPLPEPHTLHRGPRPAPNATAPAAEPRPSSFRKSIRNEAGDWVSEAR